MVNTQILDGIISQLETQRYDELDIAQLHEISNKMKAKSTPDNMPVLIDQLQTINNKLWENKAYNEISLDLQAYINMFRNEFDITDEREYINQDENGQYVQ